MKKILFLLLLLLPIVNSCEVSGDPELLELMLEIKNQNEELREELKSLQAKSDSLIIDLKNSASKQEELMKKVSDLQLEMAKVLSQIGKLTEQLNSQDADLEAIKSQLAELKEKYQGILVQLEQLQKLSQILAEIEKLKGQLLDLDGKYQVILGNLAQNKEQLDALKTQISSLQSQLAINLTKISELTSQLGDQGVDIENILKQIEALKANCADLKLLIENLLSNKSPVPLNGLVGWWPFNGNSKDESGNENHAQNNGGIPIPDRFGKENKAYFFNNSYMLIPYISKYDFQNFSISVWVTTSQVERAVILKQNNFQNAQKERFSIAINDLMENGLQFAIKYNQPNCLPGLGWEKNESKQPIFDAKFHHMVGTVEGNSIKVYLDGKLVKVLTTNYANSSLCFGGDIQIGREWASSPNYFKGTIDDIGIWNRALTAEEISKIFKGEGF